MKFTIATIALVASLMEQGLVFAAPASSRYLGDLWDKSQHYPQVIDTVAENNSGHPTPATSSNEEIIPTKREAAPEADPGLGRFKAGTNGEWSKRSAEPEPGLGRFKAGTNGEWSKREAKPRVVFVANNNVWNGLGQDEHEKRDAMPEAARGERYLTVKEDGTGSGQWAKREARPPVGFSQAEWELTQPLKREASPARPERFTSGEDRRNEWVTNAKREAEPEPGLGRSEAGRGGEWSKREAAPEPVRKDKYTIASDSIGEWKVDKREARMTEDIYTPGSDGKWAY